MKTLVSVFSANVLFFLSTQIAHAGFIGTITPPGPPASVPEPTMWPLLGIGLAAIVAKRFFSRK